ncbi:hypothetical protein EYF80_023085 [Liparis tanakae]|uniref:Uncharacterized protein n=1 Tax=Liparis tanakae TaxID=230148 RepID=A0A4Z2HLJ1_9TELE|nr:hypothetical protein EYF80_023085 [Liparis tanakae]
MTERDEPEIKHGLLTLKSSRAVPECPPTEEVDLWSDIPNPSVQRLCAHALQHKVIQHLRVKRKTFLLVPSSDCRAAAQLNVTAVTLSAVGYASVSWACEHDGEAKVQPDTSHRLWSRMVNPTGDHMCSLNQEGETVVVEANSW